jgi:hypothetical protein
LLLLAHSTSLAPDALLPVHPSSISAWSQ